MPILTSSLAVAVGAGVQNVVLQPSANVLTRNIVLIGNYLAAKNGTVTDNIPVQVADDAVAGNLYGFGSILHRMVLACKAGHGQTVTMWCIPQQEPAGVAATSSTFAITGPATAAGTLAIYVAGIRYPISVNSGDSAAMIGGNLVAAITADPNCPCTASGAASVSLVAKNKGLWGNYIVPAVNILPGDALPGGVGCTVTVLSGGTLVGTLQSALNGMGTGSNQNILPNGQQATDIVVGFAGANATIDQTSETAIATWNGLGNVTPPNGNFDHLVAKPVRWLFGDITSGASVPSADTTFATTNLWDRGGGMIAAPGSNTHPVELACIAMGVLAKMHAYDAAYGPAGAVLPGVDPGYVAAQAGNRWTDAYLQRDNAVKGGVSPTRVVGGNTILQNVVTFYSTNTNVPTTSNGYRSMRNISVEQNLLSSAMINFSGPKWQGFKVVSDTNLVTDPVAKQTARDTGSVIEDWVALIKSWAGFGWIYEIDKAIASVSATGAVTVRTGADGFVSVFNVILSGEGNILDGTINFDVSIAILSVGTH
jgi:phage tail sheath gpL-like